MPIDLTETNRLLREITEFAESTPLDLEAVRKACEDMDAVAKAVEFNEYLKRRRRRERVERFLGFQRRILYWVFNAKKIPWRHNNV